METQDFNTTFMVDQTPMEVFNAVTNVRGWWSEEIDGNTSNVNDEFLYHYQDMHYCKVRLTEVTPGKKVVWHVLENFFKFTKDKTEWKNTKIVFEISKQGKQTQLHFTHVGLVPDYECFEVCEEAWTNYIKLSLRNLIVSGKGQPNPKEGGFNAQIIKKWNLQ